MTKYDTNIVLVSAATVLLAANNGCFSAYAFTPQQQIGKYQPSGSFLNDSFPHNIKGINIHPIIRKRRCDLREFKSETSTSSLYSSPRRSNNKESWSKQAMSSTQERSETRMRGESRYGVRKRVKSVLEKAKKRTGIRNNSEDFLNSSIPASSSPSPSQPVPSQKTPPPPSSKSLKTTSSVTNVVAEAASIGGLGAVVVDEKEGKIDVALDYVPLPKVAVEKQTEEGKNEEDKKNIESGKSDASNTENKASKEEKDIPTIDSTSTKKKTSPASTYSPSNIPTNTQPEDILVPAAKKNSIDNEQRAKAVKSIPEVDALKGDVSAAFSMPPPPLPFTLPKLSREQNNQLLSGERVQFQSDMGREGSGFVAVDVKAPANVIWECLLDFYSYPQTIPTVRDVQMFTNTHLAQDYYAEKQVDRIKYEDGTLATLKHGVPSVTRAAFTLSKFRLKIAAIHKYRTHPQGDYMIFTLDPACTNLVLQNAKGVWHTQSNPDGRGEEYTRVWLLCELKVSSLLPKWIVDYAAKKAMPRASSWIKPHCEAAAELWFKELDN